MHVIETILHKLRMLFVLIFPQCSYCIFITTQSKVLQWNLNLCNVVRNFQIGPYCNYNVYNARIQGTVLICILDSEGYHKSIQIIERVSCALQTWMGLSRSAD